MKSLLLQLCLLTGSLISWSSSLTRGKVNANLNADAEWDFGHYKGGNKYNTVSNWLSKGSSFDPRNPQSFSFEQDIENLKRSAKAKKSAATLDDLDLGNKIKNQKAVVTEAVGNPALAGLVGDLPLELVAGNIEKLKRSAKEMVIELETQTKTVVLSIDPKPADEHPEANTDAPECEEDDCLPDQPEKKDPPKEEPHYSAKKGVIHSIIVNAMAPTEGVLFNQSKCSMNADGTIPIPANHATFAITKTGIQKVELDRGLEIHLNQPLIMAMSINNGIVPIAADLDNDDAKDKVIANLPELKTQELSGSVLKAEYLPDVNSFAVEHQQFERAHKFQMFMLPVIEVIEPSQHVTIVHNGITQLMLVDQVKDKKPDLTQHSGVLNSRPQASQVPSDLRSRVSSSGVPSRVSGLRNSGFSRPEVKLPPSLQ